MNQSLISKIDKQSCPREAWNTNMSFKIIIILLLNCRVDLKNFLRPKDLTLTMFFNKKKGYDGMKKKKLFCRSIIVN